MAQPEDLSVWRAPERPGDLRLTGHHAAIEPLEAAHAEPLHNAFRADDAIWAWLPYGPFENAASYAAWVAEAAGRSDPKFFAIRKSGDAGPSGVASLMRADPPHGVIEIGHICFAPALQRSPAATEAVFLLADWAFAAGYRRLEWKCNARNGPSLRAAARFGFDFEGVFRQHMIVKGVNRDTSWFAILDRDWPDLRAAYLAWLDPGNFDLGGRQGLALSGLTEAARLRAQAEPRDP